MSNRTIKLPEPIPVNLAGGRTIHLRPYVTKSGGVAYGFGAPGQESYSGSVRVSSQVFGGKFPKSVTVLGGTFDAKHGVTEEKVVVSKRTGKSRVTTPAGLPKVVYSGIVQLNGEDRRFTLWVHDLGDGIYRVGGGLIRPVGMTSAKVLDTL